MKRYDKFILILIGLSYPSISFCQNSIAYYDAIKIKNLGTVNSTNGTFFIADANRDDLMKILVNYDKDVSSSSSNKSVSDEFNDNIFISATPPANAIAKRIYWSAYPNATGGPVGTSSTIKGALNSLANLDVTNIARGISQFMIDRAKQELTAAFFNRLKKHFEDNPEIQVLFPKTSASLGQLLSYHYSEMLPTLRNNFFDDLKLVPIHLDDVLELPKYRELLKNSPEIRIAIKTIRLVSQLENEALHPSEIIEKFAGFPEWQEDPAKKGLITFGNSLKLSQILSTSVRSEDGSKDWISISELQELLSDDVTFFIYMGLIYQQLMDQNIQFYKEDGTAKQLHRLLNDEKDVVFLFQNYVSEFVELGDKLEAKINELKSIAANNEKASSEDIYDYINLSVDIIEYCLNTISLFDIDIKVDNYVILTRSSNDLYKNIFQGEYSEGITNAVSVLEMIVALLEDDSSVNQSKVNQLASCLKYIRKYGLFAANLVNADNPVEVMNVLEASALPVGTSSLKKHSDFNISIQSYLGAGFNLNKFGSTSNQRAWENQVRVFAPIGVSFDHGFGKWGSIGVYFSLLDVGAIVDYELKMDTTFSTSISSVSGDTTTVLSVNPEQDVKIKLNQIFSPGIFLTYGLPFNTPVALGVGAQYGPGLLELDESNGFFNSERSWRAVFSITVDIPWFTLYNNEKRVFR